MARFSFRPLFRRVSSRQSTTADSTQSEGSTSDTTAATSTLPTPNLPTHSTRPRKSSSVARLRERSRTDGTGPPQDAQRRRPSNISTGQTSTGSRDPETARSDAGSQTRPRRKDSLTAEAQSRLHQVKIANKTNTSLDRDDQPDGHEPSIIPNLTLRKPTPVSPQTGLPLPHESAGSVSQILSGEAPASAERSPDQRPRSAEKRAHEPLPLDTTNAQPLKTVIDGPLTSSPLEVNAAALPTSALPEHFTDSLPDLSKMLQRKIWVKRPNASATLVQIRETDLVDDVREMILRKYANSLGKSFDAPDMNLSIVSRTDNTPLRVLGPEEEICKVLDSMFPDGQTVNDALIIDVPHKRTPRPSPRHAQTYAMEDWRPHENGTDYFPPMPAIIQPALPHHPREHHSLVPGDHPRSMAVINGGHLPPLPSPGTGRRHKDRDHRPKYSRQHTSSPILPHSSTVAANVNGIGLPPAQQSLPVRQGTRPRHDSIASEPHPNGAPAAPPLPTPPAPEAPPTNKNASTPPTPNSSVAASHGYRPGRSRKSRKTMDKASKSRGQQSPPNGHGAGLNLPSISSMLDGSVPPINVLIVEDNIINLRILEGLMKRLKVRWQTAMNGQIAVDKWKAGGFHLVLMDIQMPIMNGLQATNEIRRLERVNSIGVFSSSSPTSPMENGTGEGKNPEDDKLIMAEGMFKSPVIIVALTASSLQSDRHEALAAGCNDFLTKPVNFVWLERKVKEWGCMQALIDFDGWRKWKDYAAKEEAGKTDEERQKEREKEEKEKIKMQKMAKLQEMAAQKERDRKAAAAAAAAAGE